MAPQENARGGIRTRMGLPPRDFKAGSHTPSNGAPRENPNTGVDNGRNRGAIAGSIPQVDPQVSFVIYGVAAPAGSKKAFYIKSLNRAVVVEDSKRTKPWKTQVTQAAGEAMGLASLLDGPLFMELTFVQPRPKAHFRTNGEVKPNAPVYPTTKPDLTKLVRGVEDSMIGVVFRDDAQIVSQLVTKEYGEPARCEVTVRPLVELARTVRVARTPELAL